MTRPSAGKLFLLVMKMRSRSKSSGRGFERGRLEGSLAARWHPAGFTIYSGWSALVFVVTTDMPSRPASAPDRPAARTQRRARRVGRRAGTEQKRSELEVRVSKSICLSPILASYHYPLNIPLTAYLMKERDLFRRAHGTKRAKYSGPTVREQPIRGALAEPPKKAHPARHGRRIAPFQKALDYMVRVDECDVQKSRGAAVA